MCSSDLQQELTVDDCAHIEGEEVAANLNPLPGCATEEDGAGPAEEELQEDVMEVEEPLGPGKAWSFQRV